MRRVSRGLIFTVLCGMIAVAAFGFMALRSDLLTLQRLSLERIEWKSARIETELVRFSSLLGRYAAGDPRIDAPRLRAGLTTFDGRIRAYLNGTVGERIRHYDINGATPQLLALIDRAKTLLAGPNAPDPAEIRALQLDLAANGEALEELALAVVWGEELRFHTIRNGLRESSGMTFTLSVVAMVLSLALVVALAMEAQRYRRDSVRSLALARQAQEASAAKSRFLSMMSHELRTPMNGVLGLVALVRQSGLPERQRRLLERAEASGRQMVDQLLDILDFAELDSKAIPVEPEPFGLVTLADALRDLFSPIAESEDIALRVLTPPDHRVVGDFARCRQVSSYLASFIIRRIATADLKISMEADEQTLTVILDTSEPAEGHPGWRAEAVLGTGSENAIQGDSLGPAIARGLLEQLGGSLVISRHLPERAEIRVHLPVKRISAPGDTVLVETGSRTTQLICEQLLRRLGCRIVDPDDRTTRASAILLPGNCEDLAHRSAALRGRHPGARMIAVGTATDPSLFDVAIPGSPQLEDLRRALSPAIASRANPDASPSAARSMPVAFAAD